jgi:hypothetical protein
MRLSLSLLRLSEAVAKSGILKFPVRLEFSTHGFTHHDHRLSPYSAFVAFQRAGVVVP